MSRTRRSQATPTPAPVEVLWGKVEGSPWWPCKAGSHAEHNAIRLAIAKILPLTTFLFVVTPGLRLELERVKY